MSESSLTDGPTPSHRPWPAGKALRNDSPERIHPRWWERLRSIICLAVLVIALGVFCALVIATGLFAFLRWGSNAVG